jgi:diazepam-binding inhibitor (GABA receptor modulating acyl-CoA-binding protein)
MSAFERAAQAIKDSGNEPGMQKITNKEKLALYGLYKQATAGDNTTAQPWAVQLEARAKWDAWTENKGKSKETAESDYINLVKNLLNQYGAVKFINGF